MILVLYAMATVGLTNLLVHGRLFDDDHLGVRRWLKARLGRFADVLDCYECAGFWAGLAVALALLSWWNPLVFVPAALAGSGLMHAYRVVADYVESKTDYAVGGDDAPE